MCCEGVGAVHQSVTETKGVEEDTPASVCTH